MKIRLFPCLIGIFLSASAFSATILWDTSHGVAGSGAYRPSRYSGYYQDFTNDLYDAGFTLTTTPTGFVSADLSATDILVVASPCAMNSQYSVAEITKIADFVSAGGGLLILGDQFYSTVEPVAGRFGFSFASSYISPNDVYTSSLVATHPAFENIDQIYLYAAEEVSGPGIIARQELTDKGLVAASLFGNGRVVAIGDSTLWTNLTDHSYDHADNAQFALNVFTHLADTTYIPEPATLVLLLTGAVALRGRRR